MSTLTRETSETRVRIELPALSAGGPEPGDARPASSTGDPFLDHMLTTLARYATQGIPTPHPRGLRNVRLCLVIVAR